MAALIVVVGRGVSSVEDIRAGESLPENWRLAQERGDVEMDFEPSGEDWCVVLPGDFDTTALDADPAVGCYGRVPEGSPALARWRAA